MGLVDEWVALSAQLSIYSFVKSPWGVNPSQSRPVMHPQLS